MVKRKRFRTLWLERSSNAILFSCRFHDALNYRLVKQCDIGLKFLQRRHELCTNKLFCSWWRYGLTKAMLFSNLPLPIDRKKKDLLLENDNYHAVDNKKKIMIAWVDAV